MRADGRRGLSLVCSVGYFTPLLGVRVGGVYCPSTRPPPIRAMDRRRCRSRFTTKPYGFAKQGKPLPSCDYLHTQLHILWPAPGMVVHLFGQFSCLYLKFLSHVGSETKHGYFLLLLLDPNGLWDRPLITCATLLSLNPGIK